MAAKLKKGDKVVVLAGKDKGKQGEITQVMPQVGKAVVEGINIAIRHTKPTQTAQGGRLFHLIGEARQQGEHPAHRARVLFEQRQPAPPLPRQQQGPAEQAPGAVVVGPSRVGLLGEEGGFVVAACVEQER